MTDTPDKSEMKACPFCGSAAMALKDWQGFWAVRCNNDGTLGKEVVPCNAAGPERPTEAEAIAAWNRRASSRPPADQVPDMVEMVRDYIYDCTKDDCGHGWTLSAEQTRHVIALAALQAVPAAGRKPTEAMIEAGATAFGIKHQSTCYPSASDWECEDAAKEIYRAMQGAALKASTGEE